MISEDTVVAVVGLGYVGLPLAVEFGKSDTVVAAVSHSLYLQMPLDVLLAKLKPGGAFVYINSAYCSDAIRIRGHRLWRL